MKKKIFSYSLLIIYYSIFICFVIDCWRHWTDMSIVFHAPLICFALIVLILIDHLLLPKVIGRKIVIMAETFLFILLFIVYKLKLIWIL